jgi:hypothetical protein
MEEAAHARPWISHDEAVTEALAAGWVDSKPVRVDEGRSMVW